MLPHRVSALFAATLILAGGIPLVPGAGAQGTRHDFVLLALSFERVHPDQEPVVGDSITLIAPWTARSDSMTVSGVKARFVVDGNVLGDSEASCAPNSNFDSNPGGASCPDLTRSWTATTAGLHTIQVTLDPDNSFNETSEHNNQGTFYIRVFDAPPPAPAPASAAVVDVAPLPIGLEGGAAFTKDGSIYYAGGWDGAAASEKIYRYDPATDQWTTMKSVLGVRQSGIQALVMNGVQLFGMERHVVEFHPESDPEWIAVHQNVFPSILSSPIVTTQFLPDLQDHVFVLGGLAGGTTPTDEIWEYTTHTKTLTRLSAKLPTGLANASSVSTGPRVFIFGGDAATGPTGDIFEFDAGKGTVRVVATLPSPRSHTSAVFDGTRYAYVFGGELLGDARKDVVRFDTTTNEVVTLSATISETGRSNTRAAWLYGYAYIIGGYGDQEDGTPSPRVTRFDPRAATSGGGGATAPPTPAGPAFTRLADMPMALYGGGAFTDGTYVYQAGGNYGEGPSGGHTKRIFRYDPAADRWGLMKHELIVGADSGGAVFIDGRALIRAGDGFARYEPRLDEVAGASESPDSALVAGPASTRLATDGETIWVLSGHNDNKGDDRIVTYDPATRTATPAGVTLPQPLFGPAVAYAGGRVYVFGGYSAKVPQSTIHAYNPAADVVQTVGALPQPFSDFATAVTVGEFVYVFSGSEVFRFDPTHPTGVERRPFSFPGDADSTSAVALNGYVYLMGGGHLSQAPSAEVWRFDPRAVGSGATDDPGGTDDPGAVERRPCYELLTCPLGDPAKVLAMLKSVPGLVETTGGKPLVGVPVFLFRAEQGFLKPAGAFRTDATGRFTVPPALDAAPLFVGAVVAGHIVMKSLFDNEASLTAGEGLSFSLPEEFGNSTAFRGLTEEEVSRLEEAVEDAKPYWAGNVRAGLETTVTVDGYAGIKRVVFVPVGAHTEVHVVIARLNEKGSDRLPDPRQGTPLSWFAAQVVDGEGREVPLIRIQFILELPEGVRNPSRAVLNHFRIDTATWEALKLESIEGSGEYSAETQSLSLFAVSEVRPSALAIAVETIAGWPYTIPVIGAAALLIAGAAAYSRLAPTLKRIPGRRPTAGATAEGPPAALPGVPTGTAGLKPVHLPETEFLLSNVSVVAGGKKILSDVSLGFRKGQILALLGPSGGGKSTTLKAILGEVPRSGDISIFGLNPERDRADLKRVVGYVSQETQLYPDMTVQDNVEYFGKQYGLKGKDLKSTVPALLRTLGLEDRAAERVRVLSGGQQRRASIAATLVHSPALLILDEPTSGLDPITRRNLWKFVGEVNRNLGVSVIVTTHFLDEAEFADHAVILHRGKVVAAGSPQQLVESLPGGGKAVVVELASTSPTIEGRIRGGLRPIEKEGLVKKVEFLGYTVRCFVKDPQLASRRLFEMFGDIGVPIKKLTSEDCGMDDVFRHYAGEEWAGSDE